MTPLYGFSYLQMFHVKNTLLLVTPRGRARNLFTYNFALLFEHKDAKVIKKNVRYIEGQNRDKNSVLDILSGEIDARGRNIEKAVRKQVNELEKINKHHDQNVTRLANKLSYIQDNIGLHTNPGDAKRTKIFANELIDMPIEKVIGLVKTLTSTKIRYGLKIETDLNVLLSHLVFRNSLDALLFSRIIMKLGLFNLKRIHSKLASDPEGFITGWNDGGRSRIRCGVALAARYKMLKDFKSAQNVISSEFQTVWLKTLVENVKKLNKSDVKNLLSVVDGLVDYGYLVTCVIKTNNSQIIYSFWETYPNDGLIKEWLEKEVKNKEIKSIMRLNEYQRFIIEMYTNPAISTVHKWKTRVLNVSKKLKLGILETQQVQKERFFAFTELLLNEMEDEMDNDWERREYFSVIRAKYDDIRRELGNKDNGFSHRVEEMAKTSSV